MRKRAAPTTVADASGGGSRAGRRGTGGADTPAVAPLVASAPLAATPVTAASMTAAPVAAVGVGAKRGALGAPSADAARGRRVLAENARLRAELVQTKLELLLAKKERAAAAAGHCAAPLCVLIVCDPGPDPDDVKVLLAAAMLHADKERRSGFVCAGVVCNGGGCPLARAKLGKAVLRVAGAPDVPVAVGSAGETKPQQPHELALAAVTSVVAEGDDNGGGSEGSGDGGERGYCGGGDLERGPDLVRWRDPRLLRARLFAAPYLSASKLICLGFVCSSLLLDARSAAGRRRSAADGRGAGGFHRRGRGYKSGTCALPH